MQGTGRTGFYRDDSCPWTMAFYKKTSGILIPAVGFDGRLQGFQIMLDVPLKHKDDRRRNGGQVHLVFLFLKDGRGQAPAAPVHLIGDPSARVVYVIEGAAESRYFPLSDRAHLCRVGRANNTARWTVVCPFGAERHGGNH